MTYESLLIKFQLEVAITVNIVNSIALKMSYDSLRKYSIGAVSRILPLDEGTCEEMINYTLSLPNNEIEGHLLDLLGHSEESYEFISKFIELKKKADDEASQTEEKSKLKPKDPSIPSWGPTAKPTTKPKSSKSRLLANKTSATISELASLKPSNKLSNAQAKKSKKKNLDNLKDIDAALSELEVAKALEGSDSAHSLQVKRVCNCMATKHPLFEVAPNCLNCGKIICSKEGLQPCSSCGNELLSEHEKREIVKILRSERELLETKQGHLKDKQVQQLSPKPAKYIKFSNSTGGNLWKAQEEAFKLAEAEAKRRREQEEEAELKKQEIEQQMRELEHYKRTKNVDEALLTAQQRLETLLHYQETGAERSKIIDNAADFEMPAVSSGSMWLSPVERALQLKKQQKQLRSFEAEESSRVGRSKKVVEMVIKDGKVKMVEKMVHMTDEQADIEELEKELKKEKLSQEHELSKNVWDYERDLNKWEKPIYTSSGEPNNDGTVAGNEYISSSSRVQHGAVDDVELVTAMPS